MFDRCLYFNLNALTRKVNKIWEKAFAEFDLSPSHAYLLRAVLAQPRMSQQAIATELNLEKSTITRFIDHLSKRGFLKRNKSGREQFITPTQKSLDLFDSLEKQGEQLYQKMSQTIGQESLDSMVSELRNTSKKLT